MSSIKSRYIWILIVLGTAFTAPARGQAQNVPGSNIVSRTLLSSDGSTKVGQRVYDNGLGDIVQEIQFYPGSALSNVVVHQDSTDYLLGGSRWNCDGIFIAFFGTILQSGSNC